MKKIALFLSILFLASSVFSQGLLTFRQLNGDTFHLNIADIQLAFIYNGSSTKLIKSGKAGSIYTLDSLGYLKNNSCNSFIDVNVNPNGARLLISKNHIDNVLKFRNGARIILPDGSQVTTTTLWADVIAQTSVPVGCGAGVDSTGNVDHGNILYVATTGDNATAVKGNPHKPWADPQTAIDAAIDGDIVHLFPGVYNYGSSGFAITNLAKKNVTFYMASGVTLFNTDAVPQTLFNMTDAGSYKILGGGSIVTGNGDNPFVLNNENLTCVIELINYTHTGGTANTSYFTQFYAAKSLNCSIKNYNSDNSRQYLAYLGSQYSLFDTVSQINIDIENVEFNMKNAPTSGSGRDFVYVGACNNTQFNLSIKNINYRGAGGNGFMWLQNTFGFRKGVINIDVQNGRFYVSSATKTNQGVINLNDDQAAIDSLSILNFACKNCESEVPILFHKGTLNNDTTVVYGLNGKFRMLGNIPAISGNINTHRSTILMNCDVIGKNANVINLTSSADYFITGKYSNSGANPIVNYNSSTSKVILRNTIAINDGTTAPIQATSAVNITTYNSYTNSTGTDPDVTHRVTSLVYDPFVK